VVLYAKDVVVVAVSLRTTELMKFMIKERGMTISKGWMVRNAKDDENTKGKRVRNTFKNTRETGEDFFF